MFAVFWKLVQCMVKFELYGEHVPVVGHVAVAAALR
jgi:hypothetical protein